MSLRRRAALLVTAASTLTALAAAPAALADTAPTSTPGTPSAPTATRADLYGAGDPTYDGVWRQAYAEMAISRSGYFASAKATAWLLAQQCADGGWPSYRADTAKPCDPKTEDTNATGIALQALRQTGNVSPAVQRGLDWLAKVQNADGGWSYNPGGPSDPDSTAVVIAGLGANAARKPNAEGKSPYDALRGFQFGCSAAPADRGSFGYPGTDGKLTPNAKATADALRGLADAGLTGTGDATATASPAAPDCAADPNAYASLDPKGTAAAAGAWISAQLAKGGGHLTAVAPGADAPVPDYGTTADAVVALAAAGRQAEAKTTYTWLAANSASWSKGNPAALAQLVLAANAAQTSSDSALQQLIALGPAPTKRATGAETSTDREKDDDDGGLSSSTTTWIVVGVVFAASAGFGILLAGRKRRQA